MLCWKKKNDSLPKINNNNNNNDNIPKTPDINLSLTDDDEDDYNDDEVSPIPVSSFILKYGDDLRKDWAVIQMFNFMNNIWGRNSVQFQGVLIQALTYKIIPMGPEYGIIELIPDCLTLKEYCEQKEKLSLKSLATLRATCAGSFMAAYIMGIRDRHYDNVLIAKDGTCFHIDFGYMLGEKVAGIDTSKLAITSDLKKLLGNDSDYKNFVDMAVLAWSVLRANYEEIFDYARLVFAYLYPQEEVESFLRTMLRIDEDTVQAQNYVRKKLYDAPKAVKTKMKNFFHGLAGKTPKGFKRKVSM